MIRFREAKTSILSAFFVGFGLLLFIIFFLRPEESRVGAQRTLEEQDGRQLKFKLEQVVRRYFELAKVGDGPALVSLFSATPEYYLSYKHEKSLKQAATGHVEEKSSNSNVRATAFGSVNTESETRFNRKYITEFFPQLIRDNNISVKNVDDHMIVDRFGRVRIIIQSHNRLLDDVPYDFYLVKDSNESWQLFQICISRPSETFPS